MRLSIVFLLCVACGSAGPPKGPDYTPVATPEAASVCPDEWNDAKEAREKLLGNDSAAAKRITANAVLAQADCERFVLAEGTFKSGTHDAVLAQVEVLRNNQRDTTNLYNEVAGYQVELSRLAAGVGKGLLNGAFARRLRKTPMPSDITELGEQSGFKAEVASLVNHFVGEAERELRDALALSEAVSGSGEYRKSACAELGFLELNQPASCGSVTP